jgi:8-oxo-dGTP pyrophosphatase MutT (NUDIX family)
VQRYQVFIDEHSISIGENRKSNQQSDSIFELFEPTIDDIKYVADWLLADKEAIQLVYLNTKDVSSSWNLFQEQFNCIEAAGGLVKNSQNQALFIHRLGKWDLPKGKVEKGETPKQSAVREVEEECGISNLKLGEKLPDTYHIYRYNDQLVLKRTYWFNMTYDGSEELVPQQEEAIEKAVWVDVNHLEEQLSNTYASLEQVILTLN